MKCKEISQIVGNPIETSKRRITADKREIKDFPKLPSATSFICKPLGDILLGGLSVDLKGWNQLWYYGESNHEPRD